MFSWRRSSLVHLPANSKFGNRQTSYEFGNRSNLVIASPSWLTIRGTLIRGSSKRFEVIFVVHDQRARRNRCCSPCVESQHRLAAALPWDDDDASSVRRP